MNDERRGKRVKGEVTNSDTGKVSSVKVKYWAMNYERRVANNKWGDMRSVTDEVTDTE